MNNSPAVSGSPADITTTPAASAADFSADVIIIGAGPGGYRAAEYAAKQGLKVIIIEQSEVSERGVHSHQDLRP